MDSFDKTRIAVLGRSAGDGMENISSTNNEIRKSWNSNSSKSFDHYPATFSPSQGKVREPKFVPYEPYKAAVSPIVPLLNGSFQNPVSQLVIDSQKVNALASSVIKLYADLEKKELPLSVTEQSNLCCTSMDCGMKIKLLEEKVANLEKEKKEVQSENKVLLEVNTDLKKMLVASLGEDIQLKVQFMTEDKALLGKEVIHLSEELESVKEQAEKFSVQCSVWESKFKASSLLVKELSQWKSTLFNKVNLAVRGFEAIQKEQEELYDSLNAAYSDLECMFSAINPGAKMLAKKDSSIFSLVQLASNVKSLSHDLRTCIVDNSLHIKSSETKDLSAKLVRQFTKAESLVNQFLKDFNQMGLDTPSSSKQSQVLSSSLSSHDCIKGFSSKFCKHCSGKVQDL